MCMDEFVKRLYDFMGIYKNFWSQNSDYRFLPIFYRYLPIFYRFLPIFYRYLPIFYRYFFKNSCTSARAPQSRFFGGKIGFFPIFRRKIGDFTDFSPIFPLIDFFSDFSSRCQPKTDFSAKYRPKKPIFCSLMPNTKSANLLQITLILFSSGYVCVYYF